jgi:hypothetical protein
MFSITAFHIMAAAKTCSKVGGNHLQEYLHFTAGPDGLIRWIENHFVGQIQLKVGMTEILLVYYPCKLMVHWSIISTTLPAWVFYL